jgi:hypothetical protein
MSFRGRVFTGALDYPQAAGKFMSVAGGSFTTAQKRALGYLVSGLSNLGIGAPGSNFLIYPFIGTTSGNNSLNLFSANTTAFNLTFVGSPTQDASGTNFNGTTQYATAPSVAIYPFSLNMANLSMGFCTSGMGTGVYIPMGFRMDSILQTKTYSTAGSYTFNPNTEAPGITSFTITAFGGGGAGGGTNGGTSNYPAGGGAGGNYATRAVTLTKAQGATSMTIVVGSGATAVSAANGNDGGTSSVVHPNFTGIAAGGGQGGRVNAVGAGGAGGTTSGTLSGGTTFAAGGGAIGGAVINRGGAGGGSSAGTGTNGNNGTTASGAGGGAGGIAPTGGVAGGAGGSNGSVGNPGTAGGGGGGGAGSTTAGNNRAGGAGGDGKVTISWTPTTYMRFTISIFNSNPTNNQLFNADVTTDATSRFSYQTTPNQLQGVRVGSRRGNTGTAADMGFYVQNNAGSAINGPAVMSTTSLDPSPLWYLGAVNNWNGTGNAATNFYSGYLNFGFIGPSLSDGQLQSMYTLITTYNSILGR